MSARPAAHCEDALRWLKARGWDLAPLTGQDRAALQAVAHCWQLWTVGDSAGRRAAVDAVAALLDGCQESSWPMARELVAHAGDWSQRGPCVARRLQAVRDQDGDPILRRGPRSSATLSEVPRGERAGARMSRGRLSIGLDKQLRGLLFLMESLDDADEEDGVKIGVIYTSEIARKIANDILSYADAVDAMGGPTDDLKSQVGDWAKGGGGS